MKLAEKASKGQHMLGEDVQQQLEIISEAVQKGELDPEMAEEMVNDLIGQPGSQVGRMAGMVGVPAMAGGALMGALGNTGTMRTGLLGGALGAGVGALMGAGADRERSQAYKEAVGFADGGRVPGLFRGVPRDRGAQIDGAVNAAVAPAPAARLAAPPDDYDGPTAADMTRDFMRSVYADKPVAGYADGGMVGDNTQAQIQIIADAVRSGKMDPELAQELIADLNGPSASDIAAGAGGALMGGLGGAKVGSLAAPGGGIGKAIGAGLGALGGYFAGQASGLGPTAAVGTAAAALSPMGRSFLGKAGSQAADLGRDVVGAGQRVADAAAPTIREGMSTLNRTGEVAGAMGENAFRTAKSAVKGAMPEPGFMGRAGEVADVVTQPLRNAANDALGTVGRAGEVVGAMGENALRTAGNAMSPTVDRAALKTGELYGGAVKGISDAASRAKELGEKVVEGAKNVAGTSVVSKAKKATGEALGNVDSTVAKMKTSFLTNSYKKAMKTFEKSNMNGAKLNAVLADKWAAATRGKKYPDSVRNIASHMYRDNPNIEPKEFLEFVQAMNTVA
jgi:polyhydroxyalkanoate synthesis regulator phasin